MPQAPKPKKPIYKRWWFWVLAVIALGIVASRLGGGDGDTVSTATEGTATSTQALPAETEGTAAPPATEEATEPSEEPPAENTAEPLPGIGVPVAVGDQAFTVVSASSLTHLDNVLYGPKDGNWILLEVMIENTGTQAVTVNQSSISLVADNGATYETDSDSMLYLDSNDSIFLEKINPGLSMQGKVLIAVTPDLTSGTVTYQPGLFGGKAEVAISVA